MHTTWHSLHQGPNISQANSPHLVGSMPQFWSSGRRIIHVSDPDPRLAPNMLSGVHVRTLCWPVHELHILFPQKSSGAMALSWVLTIHKVSSKNARCPGKHTIVEKPDVVESSIQHHHFTPLMVDCTPYYDWGAMVTAHWLDACIYRSLPLPAAHSTMTTTVKREARLITEDTVPPLSEVPPFAHSSPHMAISSVTQSQSGTPGGTPRLIASSPEAFTMLWTDNLFRNRWIISTHKRAAGMERCQWLSRLTVCLLRLWSDSHFQASTDVTNQCLSCIAKFCWRTLATQHSCHLSLKITISQQFYNTHQYLLLKIHGMMPSKNDRKCKMILQEAHIVLNRQSACTLHTKWQQLGWLPFQSVPVLYCVVATSVGDYN